MVSMKEIAKQCNVSVATVSKALNGYSDIGEETKNYILRTASEMGYLPNSSARALKTKRTFNLGVLFVDEARSGLTHDYFNRVLEKLQKAPQKRKVMTSLLQAEMFPVRGDLPGALQIPGR